MGLERLFSVLRIGASGLSAQRKFLEATASNIANVETTETETGEPYVARRVRFREMKEEALFGRLMRSEMARLRETGSMRETMPVGQNSRRMWGSGVEAEEFLEDRNATKIVYEPENPQADTEGYVRKPNINLVQEMVNMMRASRIYEANVSVMNAAKGMMKKALEI